MGEETKAKQAETMARRLLWLAFCWNDHNFDPAHEEARKEAEKHGIRSFDEANAWLTSADSAAEQMLGRYAEQAEAIRELLDVHAPHTSGNIVTRVKQVLGGTPMRNDAEEKEKSR